MKVLFVSSGNSHYGVVPFIKSQGESLRRKDVELEFYTIKGKGIKGYLSNIKPLRQHIKKNSYDLIHAHYGLIGLLCVLTFTKIPIVLSIMGSDAYGDFDTNGKRNKSSYLIMFLTQIALFYSKQIIVKSKNLYDFIQYKNKCHIIPNGVDFNVFKPFSKDLGKNRVLWLANPEDPRKNYNLFKNAINIINIKKIEVISPYPISHKEFSEYLNSSSVFVLTSYNEGSPNVVKEAMACDLPVVSTDVGDVKWLFGNEPGYYLTSFDPKDVAEKIKLALDFKEKYGKTNGRRRIIDLGLNSETIAKKIINVYKQVLNAK